jgi:hypothetical protein
MSEGTRPGGGFSLAPEKIEEMLSAVREVLGMDFALVSEFAGDKMVFCALERDAESFGWREGKSFPDRRILLQAGARQAHFQHGPRREARGRDEGC